MLTLIEKINCADFSEKEKDYLRFLVNSDEIFLTSKKYKNYKEFLNSKNIRDIYEV